MKTISKSLIVLFISGTVLAVLYKNVFAYIDINNKYLVHATSYRTVQNNHTIEYAVLGYYYFYTDNTVDIKYWKFNAEENKKPLESYGKKKFSEISHFDYYKCNDDHFECDPVNVKDDPCNCENFEKKDIYFKANRSEFSSVDRTSCLRLRGYIDSTEDDPALPDDCPDRTIHVPIDRYDSPILSGKWEQREEGNLKFITITINNTVYHEWKLKSTSRKQYILSDDYYIMSASERSHVINGKTYQNGRGYGYISDKITCQPLRKENFIEANNENHVFIGERAVNNQNSPTAMWKRREVTLPIYHYNISSTGDIDLLEYDGNNPDSLTCCCPYMMTHHAILLNNDPFSNLIFYKFDGHDYNYDGCFTYEEDRGHQYMIFGIIEEINNYEMITKMVFIEYSHQESSGYPIIGIGHYYRRW